MGDLSEKQYFFKKLLSVIEEKFFSKLLSEIVIYKFLHIIFLIEQIVEIHLIEETSDIITCDLG